MEFTVLDFLSSPRASMLLLRFNLVQIKFECNIGFIKCQNVIRFWLLRISLKCTTSHKSEYWIKINLIQFNRYTYVAQLLPPNHHDSSPQWESQSLYDSFDGELVLTYHAYWEFHQRASQVTLDEGAMDAFPASGCYWWKYYHSGHYRVSPHSFGSDMQREILSFEIHRSINA